MEEIVFFEDKPLSSGKISEAFKLSYGRDLKANYIDWKLISNPNQEKVYACYYEVDGRVASCYSVCPNVLMVNDRKLRVAQSVMTMTIPEFRNRGLFKQLLASMSSKLGAEGFDYIYGFANKHSHYGFRRDSSWRDLGALNLFSLARNSLKTNKCNAGKTCDFSIHELKDIDLTGFDDLKFTEKMVSLSRDSKNLRWRLIENPVNSYQTLDVKDDGVLLLRILFKKYCDKEIDILEIFYGTSGHLDFLPSAMLFLINTCCEAIHMWSNLFSDEHLVLEKIGFCETVFNTYFGLIPLQVASSQNTAVFDLHNWHYRFFDSDLF